MKEQQLQLFPATDEQILAKVTADLPRDTWLTPKEVAATANISLSLVYELIRTGDLRSMNFGAGEEREYRKVLRQSVLDWFKKRLAN